MRIAGDGAHLAGLGVHLRQRDQEDAAAGDGLALPELGGDGHVLDRDRPRGRAAHVDVAAAVRLQVRGVDLQLLGGGLHHDAARFLGSHHHGVADAMRAARGEAAHVVRAGVGVGGVDVDIGDRHPQRLRRDLARDLLHALAEIDGRERDGELAVRV